MAYDLFPAVDENYNFPPEVRAALAKTPELRNTVIPMTTVERNNLLGEELWDGRLIFNVDVDRIQQYNGVTSQWEASSISDHGTLAGLADDDHPQYLLRQGQSGVAAIERILLRTDQRATTLAYTGGKLSTVTEKVGTTPVKTTTLSYTGETLTSVTETAGGIITTTTMTYDGSGNLTDTTRSVS